MKIHECARCEGCGHVTGLYGWEIPWTKWAGNEAVHGVLRPHVCPDCGGTGALIEMPVDVVMPGLASRRGIPPRNRYAEHVALLLQSQSLRPTVN